ncbi:hypothetical protein [Streptomyces sp. SCL15-4]|uniref:hypothetical protein n=1 Tax=Streptomyces sp. SCL15-4 TaxID=2967221 RepID=UPI00296685EC|nr:hypothetical protein [Streptomyces sp. SCL15-4]
MTIELTANTPPSTSEQRAQLAELIGDAQPATNRLLEQLAESIRDRREHDHPTWEDLYCLNLVSWMGERMGPVLRRVLDAEARIAELESQDERRRVRLAAAEADLLAVRGLLSPAGGPRRVPAEMEIHERVAPAVEWLLTRVADLEQLLASKNRPVDEDPIAYSLTPKAAASVDRLTRLFAPTQALREDANGEAGGR